MKTYKLFIDGAFADPASGEWFDSVNPYTGLSWARIPRGNDTDVARAVAAAKHAMTDGPWARMSATERGLILTRLGDLILANAERLARTEVQDNGKLLTEMLGQLKYIPNWWRYYGGLADKVHGQVMPIDKPDMFAFSDHDPVGVVAAITAWNSPLLFVAVKCAPALAAGCAVVVKPSEFASASTLEFAELASEAGIPPGVFNVVTGFGHEAGNSLVDHPDVAKITFTGSDVTGAAIYSQAAKSMKRVALELGGKSPNIVFADANLDAAVAGVVSGIFAATGQTCIAGSRLLVQNSIRESFVARLVEMARSARIGDPMLPGTNIGPVTTPGQYQKVLDYIGIAKSEGAQCILGGKQASGEGISGGQFVEPTIFDDVKSDMRIAREEVFGPVLSILGFDSEEEAVRIANDTIYGLAAGVWTKDMNRALRLRKSLRAGTIWINTYRAISFMMPFGGMKYSGLGRENGIDAIHDYLERKSVWISTSDSVPGNPFVMR